MSSARILLALVVSGLAACAHTRSESVGTPPDVRHAAPIIVADAAQIPEGFDEHVLIVIDRDGLERLHRRDVLNETGIVSAHQGSAYYYYRTASRGRPSGGGAMPTQNDTVMPAPVASPMSRPAGESRSERMGQPTRRSRR